MTSISTIAASFCRLVAENPDINNSDARIGAWLIGAVGLTGDNPIELTVRDIAKGCERNGVKIDGTGSRHETIRAALDRLSDLGVISREEGRQVGFGFTSQIYSIHEV